MAKYEEPVGFKRQNYVKGGGKHKGLGLFVIAGSLLILWIALMIGMNLYLKDLHAIGTWVFLGPLDILKIIWKVSMGPGIESGVLKWKLVSYIIWPIATTVILSAILFRAADSIAKSSKPTGVRYGTSRFATLSEIMQSDLLEDDLTPYLAIHVEETIEERQKKFAKEQTREKIYFYINCLSPIVILYFSLLFGLNIYLRFYEITSSFTFLSPFTILNVLFSSPGIWFNLAVIGPIVFTIASWIIVNDYLNNHSKKFKSSIGERPSGVVLSRVKLKFGQYKYLIERSYNEHILAYAPSRSGKGVGLVIPSIYMWGESSIILDPKGENFDETSGYLQKKGHRCIRLDLGRPYHRYNPLSDLKNDTIELPDEVNRVVGIITADAKQNGGSKDKFWDNQAKSMLTVMLTYLVAAFEPKRDKNGNVIKATASLYDLAMFVSGINPLDDTIFEDDEEHNAAYKLWTKIANYQKDYPHHLRERGLAYFDKIGSYLESEAYKFRSQNDQVRQNIVSSADQFLSLFKLPIIAAIIGASDFKLTDLIDPTQPPTTLYLINPPKDDLTGKTDSLIRLILQNLFISVLYETGLRLKTNEKGLWHTLDTYKDKPMKLPKNFTPLEKLMITHLMKKNLELVEFAKYEKLLINIKNGNYVDIKPDLLNEFLNEPIVKSIGTNTYGYTKRPVLCMMDEFPKLGKFEMMEKLLGDAAGYGAKFYLIAQSDKQISEAYGEKNPIFAGCRHKVIYRPADFDTAKNMSEMLGDYTHIEEDVNVNDSGGAPDVFKKKTASKNWNQTQRRILTPDEVMALEDMDSIVWSNRLKIFGHKIVYWDDSFFAKKNKDYIPPVSIREKPLVDDEDLVLDKLRKKGIDVDRYYLSESTTEPETTYDENSDTIVEAEDNSNSTGNLIIEDVEVESKIVSKAAKPRAIQSMQSMRDQAEMAETSQPNMRFEDYMKKVAEAQIE